MKSIVDQSHDFLKDALHKGAICIDATLGWGKDTNFFLKNKVRKVYGFEIQQEVFEQTVSNITDSHFVPVFDGHQNMDAYVKEEVDAIIFNFGYCPGFNSQVKTNPKTSLEAIEKTLYLLKKKGRMALVIYPHEEGREESKAIEMYLKKLDSHAFYIEKRTQLNQDHSPYLIGIEKLK